VRLTQAGTQPWRIWPGSLSRSRPRIGEAPTIVFVSRPVTGHSGEVGQSRAMSCSSRSPIRSSAARLRSPPAALGWRCVLRYRGRPILLVARPRVPLGVTQGTPASSATKRSGAGIRAKRSARSRSSSTSSLTALNASRFAHLPLRSLRAGRPQRLMGTHGTRERRSISFCAAVCSWIFIESVEALCGSRTLVFVKKLRSSTSEREAAVTDGRTRFLKFEEWLHRSEVTS